jgi:hypothetical protein
VRSAEPSLAAVTDDDSESDFEQSASPLVSQHPSASTTSVSSDNSTAQPIDINDHREHTMENLTEITPETPIDLQQLPVGELLELANNTSYNSLETPEDVYNNPLENATWIDPDLMAAFSYFFEGPQWGRSGEKDHSRRKRKTDTDKRKDPQSLLDVPFMFISLLTYPDVPQETETDKAQKIQFAGRLAGHPYRQTNSTRFCTCTFT